MHYFTHINFAQYYYICFTSETWDVEEKTEEGNIYFHDFAIYLFVCLFIIVDFYYDIIFMIRIYLVQKNGFLFLLNSKKNQKK